MKMIDMYGAYEAPKIEVIEVQVEQGFATSVPGFDNDGDPFTPSN